MALVRVPLRNVAAVVVILSWAGSLAWLAIRGTAEAGAASLSGRPTLRLSPGVAWFAVTAGGTQIGHAGITLDTLATRGYSLLETVTLEIPRSTGLERQILRTDVTLDPTFGLESARTRWSSDDRRISTSVAVARRSLDVSYALDRAMSFGRVRVDTVPAAAQMLPFRLALGGHLTAGRIRSLFVLDGTPGGVRETALRVGSDTVVSFADSSVHDVASGAWKPVHRDSVRAVRVVVDAPAGPYRMLVDNRGVVAGLEYPMGVRWIRDDYDQAMSQFRATMTGRAAGMAAALTPLAVYASAQGSDADTAHAQFRVTRRDGAPVDAALLGLLSGGRQRVARGIIDVDPRPMVSGALDNAAVDLLVFGSTDDLARDDGLKADSIVNLAAGNLRRLIGMMPSLAKVDITPSATADAAKTLTRGRGNPDGIARLFVSLARLSGIPARYVNGFAARGDTLYTHAWVEVWDAGAGGWRAVDPVRGSTTASTSLIRLGFAGSSHPDDMRPQLADVRVERLTGVTP